LYVVLMSRVHHRQRARILKRDNYRCKICNGINELDMHHIIPQKEGGTSDDLNVLTLCKIHHDLARIGVYCRPALKALIGKV